jgi:polar amino acid transport system substrate-binding protein
MRTFFPKAWLGLVVLLLAAPFVTPAADPAASPGPVLRVGVAPVSPPMIFKEGKNVVGVEADLAQALGRELGRPIKFVELAWEDLIDALDADKIDIIMSSMSMTRARQFRLAFCDPYLRIGQMGLVRAEESQRLGVIDTALADLTIGVKKATTGDMLVQQEFPRAKRKYFKSGDDAAQALRKGKIDLFINDSPMIWYLAGTYESKGLTVWPVVLSEEALAWGVKRSDAELQKSANAFLKKLKDSGELDQTLRRWMPRFR